MSTIRSLALGLFLNAALLGTGGAFAAEPTIHVFKTPTCGCCTKCVSHLRAHGLEVESTDLRDLGVIKSMAGITPERASCHTAKVDGYVIEGHVPAEKIRRLLTERPEARGLTVPGMPLGSPGMELPTPQSYQVRLIGEDGSTQVFAQH